MSEFLLWILTGDLSCWDDIRGIDIIVLKPFFMCMQQCNYISQFVDILICNLLNDGFIIMA